MATKESKQWWDPYETSNRRQFVHWPKSAAEILVCPTSTSFIDSSSQSGPIGSTLYNKEFCWKSPCKPQCICTGTASGQRRNNPHPSQSFMKGRLPRDAARSSEYVGSPWKCPPSEGEMRKALTAQYSSIYRCDYMSMPQEMRDNYRQPKQKLELLGNSSHDRCTHPKVTCRGIVPTVVQRHTQQKTSYLTNYDRFCGKRLTNVTNMIKSLLPQELQQLHTTSPEEEKEAVKTVMSINAHPNREKVNKLPPVVLDSCSPKWISSWPGPL
ncbi:testis-expressed protein 26-like isoform X2 [Cyclopterus lumpus]|uniref:testis-expressed protein 26-like isoform X2 n=1 Tax=Cyclopterus lumpus TaxID=8103 RepID=UPI0014870690|nr:testis-expressed protein 26-like isoform X2 [Cyclopterus lumpus]